MRRRLGFFLLSLIAFGMMTCKKPQETPAPPAPAPAPPPVAERKLFNVPDDALLKSNPSALTKVDPGDEADALQYYKDIRANLGARFPQANLIDSRIPDMLVYYGFPALLAKDIESLDPAVLMDFAQLRTKVSNPQEFDAAYRANPLRAGEIRTVRFFAPKIINVRDPQVNGVPKGGFGWRKVVRFRARDGSFARAAGLDFFYLLFNFTTQTPKFPPAGTHAAQLQGILKPIYPHQDRHRDIYFLVYLALNSPQTPEKVGTFLTATFDLAGVVPEDKYYVPVSCAQCHGTTASNQKAGKINYLDTDHWIDRTGDDFKAVNPADVIVDGAPAYAAFRDLNQEIADQNTAVGGQKFALLATLKWLDLHKVSGADATKHVPPLRRGFIENAGDKNWTEGAAPDTELLPLLNQYCFRCHSSIRYHVFQKQAVFNRKGSITSRVNSGNMPLDRVLDATTRQKIIDLMGRL